MFMFVLLQFRVPCGRPTPPGAGQTGEDWLPLAVHDGRRPDAGVVPPPEDGMIGVQKCSWDHCKMLFPSSTVDPH